MQAQTAVAFFIFLFEYSNGYMVKNQAENSDELIAVAVLYRDGDRTPTSSFPNDEYFDASHWPMGFGQLTEQGKLRQYELGQWYRQRYNDFLPELYHPEDIYVLSTDTDQALMSAEVNLAGLYPPKGDQVWNKNLLWQPIPVHTLPTDQDQVLYMERPCSKYNRLYDEVYNNEYFQKINEDYADFYQEVSELTGWIIDDVHFFYKLQTVLYIYLKYNTSYLPSWYANLDQEKLNYLAGLDFARYTFTDEMKRLGDGPFFDNLFTAFDAVLSESVKGPKFLMLSAHQSTIASVLNGMGVFDNNPPEFASSVIWELRRNDDGYYVNFFYKRSSDDVADLLKLPDCDYNCEYDTFKSLLEPFTLDLASWDIECIDID